MLNLLKHWRRPATSLTASEKRALEKLEAQLKVWSSTTGSVFYENLSKSFLTHHKAQGVSFSSDHMSLIELGSAISTAKLETLAKLDARLAQTEVKHAALGLNASAKILQFLRKDLRSLFPPVDWSVLETLSHLQELLKKIPHGDTRVAAYSRARYLFDHELYLSYLLQPEAALHELSVSYEREVTLLLQYVQVKELLSESDRTWVSQELERLLNELQVKLLLKEKTHA